MNSNTQKLVAYLALGLVCTALMITWGVFAFYARTSVPDFISQIRSLIGIVITLAVGLGGFHAAIASNGKNAAPTDTVVVTPVAAPTVVEQQ